MHKTESAGMKRLTGAQRHAVVNKFTVGSRTLPPQYLIAAIAGIAEQRVTDVTHVGTDLMRTSGFKHTFHHAYRMRSSSTS